MAVLLGLMITSALLEMLGLSMLIPIVDVISDPSKLKTNGIYVSIAELIGAGNAHNFIMRFSVIVVGFILIKNLFLGYVNLKTARFIKGKEIETSNRLIHSYLMKPYIDIAHRNSADLIRNINQEVGFAYIMVVNTILTVVSEVFVMTALLGLMLYMSVGATVLAFCIFFTGSIFFIVVVKRVLKKLGAQRQEARGRMIEWATQTFNAFKEILVASKQGYFLSRFENNANKAREAEIFDLAMARIPQLFIETFAIVTMLVIIGYIYSYETNFIAILSAFALVMLRLMPTVNRVMICLSRARFYSSSLFTVTSDLEKNDNYKELIEYRPPAHFERDLHLKNISFEYPNRQIKILNNLDLHVKKGEIVSITGPSGSGKTTLMDIILGLLHPHTGEILLDGKVITADKIDTFRGLVSYLPQSVYLINASIRENIAFGVNEDDIDDEKIFDVLNKVELADMITGLPKGIRTIIGDISGKISGGQRQRIGIARALYHDKDIVFLDEATSGLDPETERKICHTLRSLTPNVTIISISHQDALINIADHVYKMENGKLKEK